MSVGLDLGSTQARSVRWTGTQFVGRQCPMACLVIDDLPEYRHALAQEDAPFVRMDGQLVLLGDAALTWSLRHREALQPLLPDGRLPIRDFLSRQVLPLVVDAVLPPPQFANEICSLTIPGDPFPMGRSVEERLLMECVTRRGYRPLSVGQGLATVLAELGAAQFSGIGINLGATQAEFALVHQGAERARCVIPCGIHELCGVVDGVFPAMPRPIEGSALATYLIELLIEAGQRIGQQDGFRVVSQPVSIVVSGGITASSEFERQFALAWSRAAWPIAVQRVHLTNDPTYTVARGALIHAKLEAQLMSARRAA